MEDNDNIQTDSNEEPAVQTEAKLDDVPEANNGIPEDEERRTFTIEDIQNSLAIRLAPAIPFWRLESGKVELNAFTGKVSARVPSSLSDYDKMTIAAGLNIGRIVVTDKVEDEKPGVRDTSRMLTNDYINARRLADIIDESEFKEIVNKIHRVIVLENCLEIERDERARKPIIKMINSRLQEIQG